MNETPTPLPPPQGVMAPAEALAVLTAEIERRSRYATGDKFCEPMLQARATFRALLARCEGLEAALRELEAKWRAEADRLVEGLDRVIESNAYRSEGRSEAYADCADELAATRTTGDR